MKAAISSSCVLARVACLVAALLTVGVVAAAPAAAAQSKLIGIDGKVTHVNLAAKTFTVSSLQGHKTYTIHANSKTHFLISHARASLLA